MRATSFSAQTLRDLHTLIFQWWRQSGRVLEWRDKLIPDSSRSKTAQVGDVAVTSGVRERAFASYFSSTFFRDPYRVVVAEVMLQQTQVERVREKYRAWMDRWPTISDLATATLSDVLIEWKGLGYNRRARYLWLLAQEIVHKREGVWPRSEQELRRLPGVGPYTARAILSFAFGQQVGVVDVNVKRVVGRWLGMDALLSVSTMRTVKTRKPTQDDSVTHAVRDTLSEKEWITLVDQLLPEGQADPWNQSLMDFGAIVCSASGPRCDVCPVRQLCQADIRARASGFASYAQFLVHTKEERAGRRAHARSGSKDTGLRFEQTDRFFRGKIVDLLREKTWKEQDLMNILHKEYGCDRWRGASLLDSLVCDGLVQRSDVEIRLG